MSREGRSPDLKMNLRRWIPYFEEIRSNQALKRRLTKVWLVYDA